MSLPADERVRKRLRLITLICLGVGLVVWAAVVLDPQFPGMGFVLLAAVFILVGIVNAISLCIIRWRNIQSMHRHGEHHRFRMVDGHIVELRETRTDGTPGEDDRQEAGKG